METSLEGWLEKKGEKGVILSWKKRYFRLVENKLFYHKNPSSSPQGHILMSEVISVHPTLNEEKDGFSFQVNTKGRCYYLFTDSEDNFNRWLMGLIRIIKTLGNEEKFYNLTSEDNKKTQNETKPESKIEDDQKNASTTRISQFNLRSTSLKSLPTSATEKATSPFVTQRRFRSPTITPTDASPLITPERPLPKPPSTQNDNSTNTNVNPNVNPNNNNNQQKSQSPVVGRPTAENAFLNRNNFSRRDSPRRIDNLGSKPLSSSQEFIPRPSLHSSIGDTQLNKNNEGENNEFENDNHANGTKRITRSQGRSSDPELSPTITATTTTPTLNTPTPNNEVIKRSPPPRASRQTPYNPYHTMHNTSSHNNNIMNNNNRRLTNNLINSNNNSSSHQSSGLSQSVDGGDDDDGDNDNQNEISFTSSSTSIKFGGGDEFLMSLLSSNDLDLQEDSDSSYDTSDEDLCDEEYFDDFDLKKTPTQSAMIRNTSWAKSSVEASGREQNTFLKSRGPRPRLSGRLDKRERVRTKCAIEIFETEESYVTSLELVISNYINGMKSSKDKRILNLIPVIFSNIELILPLNLELLSLLRDRLSNWSAVQLLGDIFIKMSPFLKLYSSYGNNYQNAISTYQKEMKENLVFKDLVEKLDAATKKDTRLHHLLIMPIQRIPRYNLLLSEIINYTDPEHPDYNNLVTALAKMKDVADHINESVRVSERDRKIEALQERMDITNLLAPHRHLIIEALVHIKEHKKKQLLLFNDIFINISRSRLKRGKEFLKPENNWPLSLVWIGENGNDNQLHIIGPVKSLLVTFDSVDEANDWKMKLKKAIADHLSTQQVASSSSSSSSIDMNNMSVRYGQFTYSDFSEYSGFWADGYKQGRGTYKYLDNVFEGMFSNNQMEGEGKLTSWNGEVFIGKWNCNSLHSGSITYPSGDKYVGEFKSFMKFGDGTMTYHNGDVYTGSWHADLPHGKGKIVYISGMRYTGEWQRGLRHGHGQFEYGNGGTYDGDWALGKRHGYGTLVNPDGSYYEGDFVNDEIEGKGVLVYKNGRKYSGYWKAGKRSGVGSYSTAIGIISSYEGEWSNDAFNGKGTILFSNNDKYEGYFKDFRMHGSGVYTYANGKVIMEGKWNNGYREGKFTIKIDNKMSINGFAKENIIYLEGQQTVIPVLPPPPYFEIDLV